MNQSEVERAVARATGESRRFVKQFGFSLVEDLRADPDPALVVDCPGCGAVLNPDDAGNRHELECPRCDAVYPVGAEELYVLDGPSAAPGSLTSRQ
jgi:hypothetical protein